MHEIAESFHNGWDQLYTENVTANTESTRRDIAIHSRRNAFVIFDVTQGGTELVGQAAPLA